MPISPNQITIFFQANALKKVLKTQNKNDKNNLLKLSENLSQMIFDHNY